MKKLEQLANEGELFSNFESELIKQQLYQKIKDAKLAATVGRQLVDVVKLKAGSSLDWILADKDSLKFRKVAEGTEIPIDTESYTKTNIEPEKYGDRIVISTELQEDANWDMLKRNINQAGRYAGLKEDELVFDAFSNGVSADNSFSSGGTELSASDIVDARKRINTNDFQADTIVMNPKQVYELQQVDTFVEADKVGNRQTWTNGFVGRMFGLDVVETTNVSADTVYVADTKEAGVLVVRRPLTMKTYEIPERDSLGVALTFRQAAKVLRDTALAKITVS